MPERVAEFPPFDVGGDPAGVGNAAAKQQPEQPGWQMIYKLSGDRHTAPSHNDIQNDFNFAQTAPVQKSPGRSGNAQYDQQNKDHQTGKVTGNGIQQRGITAGYQKKDGAMIHFTQKFAPFNIFAGVVNSGTAEHKNQTYSVKQSRRQTKRSGFDHFALQDVKYSAE